jgi:hypothetical protein
MLTCTSAHLISVLDGYNFGNLEETVVPSFVVHFVFALFPVFGVIFPFETVPKT